MKYNAKIIIPDDNLNERLYILDVMFGEFLGINFEVILQEKCSNWIIELPNSSKLIFEDHFFNKFPNNLEYLKEENIPRKVKFTKNEFTIEDDIPVIFGETSPPITNHYPSTTIMSSIDIFASSFFMLTRWEEYVNKARDNHDRFSAYDSLAYKNNFLNRPIVNEYVQMLKNMLLHLDNNLDFKLFKAKIYISCDVDIPFNATTKNFKTFSQKALNGLKERKSLGELYRRTRLYLCNLFGNYKYDLNWTFDYYIDICDKNNLIATFYFIPKNSHKMDGDYSLGELRVKRLLNYINKRGQKIGVHGSYDSYNNQDRIIEEKSMLENILKDLKIDQKIVGNRQHYLRWDSIKTPALLDKAGHLYDTTGSYAQYAGFRYGICYEFSMFDFLNQTKLNLKQRALIVMEGSILGKNYMNLNYKDGLKVIHELKQKCFKYDGNFTILWHNSFLQNKENKELFETILKGEKW